MSKNAVLLAVLQHCVLLQ